MKYVIKILNPSKEVIFETERDFNTESAPVEIAKRLLKKLGIEKGGSYKIQEQHLTIIEEDQEEEQEAPQEPTKEDPEEKGEDQPEDQEEEQEAPQEPTKGTRRKKK